MSCLSPRPNTIPVDGGAWLNNTTISLGMQNVFDEDPPFVAGAGELRRIDCHDQRPVLVSPAKEKILTSQNRLDPKSSPLRGEPCFQKIVASLAPKEVREQVAGD